MDDYVSPILEDFDTKRAKLIKNKRYSEPIITSYPIVENMPKKLLNSPVLTFRNTRKPKLREAVETAERLSCEGSDPVEFKLEWVEFNIVP